MEFGKAHKGMFLEQKLQKAFNLSAQYVGIEPPEVKISRDFDIERLSKMALEDPSTSTNPKKMSIDHMKELYEHSMSGKLFK